MPAVTGWICTPIQPRVTWPCSLSWATTDFAVSAGISNPMPTEPPDGEIDRGVDADHIAVDVERRAAGIAFVDRRVDLDVVVIGAGADVAAARRDDAGRHRAAEAERIADRDHPVADPRLVIGELDVGKVVLAVDLDQREIGLRIGADHLGRVDRAIVGRDLRPILA